MLDLETLGTAPGSVILSIGACDIDCLSDDFLRFIDPASALAAGLTCDLETLTWWLRQPAYVRAQLSREGEPLTGVLRSFARWLGPEPVDEIWAKGASFDFPLLLAAYHAVQERSPWVYSRERCFRTMAAQFPGLEPKRAGMVLHFARDDALHQAHWLRRIERRVKNARRLRT
jgi:hypothetical protein